VRTKLSWGSVSPDKELACPRDRGFGSGVITGQSSNCQWSSEGLCRSNPTSLSLSQATLHKVTTRKLALCVSLFSGHSNIFVPPAILHIRKLGTGLCSHSDPASPLTQWQGRHKPVVEPSPVWEGICVSTSSQGLLLFQGPHCEHPTPREELLYKGGIWNSGTEVIYQGGRRRTQPFPEWFSIDTTLQLFSGTCLLRQALQPALAPVPTNTYRVGTVIWFPWSSMVPVTSPPKCCCLDNLVFSRKGKSEGSPKFLAPRTVPARGGGVGRWGGGVSLPSTCRIHDLLTCTNITPGHSGDGAASHTQGHQVGDSFRCILSYYQAQPYGCYVPQ
jgi:hypothetical protein